jgi:hypothetical protein
MELVLLSTILVAAMATVDIPETHDEEEGSSPDLADRGEKPYGVHG